MARVSFDNLRLIVDSYQNSSQLVWSHIIDALGATQSIDTLMLLNDIVFGPHQTSFNITMRALAQLIGLQNCPPPVRICPFYHDIFIWL